MAPTKILGALLALLVVATGAAAAMPGNAPVDAPDRVDNQTTDAERAAAQAELDETDETDEADESGAAEDRKAGDPPEDVASERGPPADMPGAAPDFVSEIHATIQNHLSGAVEDLGSAVSKATPGGEAGGDADEELTQDQGVTETPDSTGEESAGPAGTPA